MRIHVLIAFMILGMWMNSFSEPFNKDLLPELYSPSNAGTEFVLSFVPVYYSAIDNYNVIILYLTSSVGTNVRIRLPQVLMDTTIEVKANKVTEFSIPAKYVILNPKPPGQQTASDKIYVKRAVNVTSESPIICYAIVRLKDYCEGFLALPVSTWSGDYNITTYNDYTNNTTSFAPSTAVVVSNFDDSRVTFRLGGNDGTRIRLSNGDSLLPSYSVVRTLDKGDVWVIFGYRANNDLSGSTIRSTKPVGVYTGNYCARVPTTDSPCQYLIEQELPTYAFSKRYYVTPIFGRTKGSMVKVSAQAVETDVRLNGVFKGKILTPNGIENEGFLSFRVNNDNQPAVISSDKRINVSQFNTGNFDSEDTGIPFKMQVLSSDNFSKLIGFSLPATKDLKLFTKNYLNIIFKLDELDNIPSDLLLIEMLDGTQITKTVRELAVNMPVQFSESESDGSYYQSLTLELPQSGRYMIKSNNPVGAVIYGYTDKDSYGFPAQIIIKNNEKPNDLSAPSVNINVFSNGTYTGIITEQPANLSSIRSNLALIHLIGDSSYNYNLQFDAIVPGVSLTSSFELRPKSISEKAQAFLRIVDFAGNDTIIRFYYSNVPQIPVIKLKEFADSVLCPGRAYTLDFDVSTGEFQGGNTFRVKLSKKNPDKPGYPVTVGEVSGILVRKVNFTIPKSLVPDSDYMIYIESTIPVVRSDTISDIRLLSLPDLNISGIEIVCADNEYQYSTQISEVSYKWTAENGQIIGADNESNVIVKWIAKGTGVLRLAYSSDINCESIKELHVTIGDDFFNEIQGPVVACENDEILYNSFLSSGKFLWSSNDGIILGAASENLVNIRWTKPGEGTLKLIYTNELGFGKEFLLKVLVTDSPDKPVITRDKSILTSSADAGNQWYYNGNAISGARAKTYDAKTVEGAYKVQCSISGCKSEFSEVYNYTVNSVNFHSDETLVKIYPNPSNELINIDLNLPESNTVKLSICDLQMSEIDIILNTETVETSKRITYSTGKLSSGIYYLRLDYDSNSHYYKLIVVK
ncbi:MAG: T9SS type A sorting domain-containing protein [Candidatus Kapabacteria bacterium]|nr:T9SS type A sorting domain-containing protein [Candidatus Kapabacteria bacterium]